LYDYPLDYEVTQMGEFYHDPAVPADKPTYLYGAVKIGTTLPNVPYEKLATLYLSTQNSTLTRKALELAGYNPDTEGYITDENETMPGTNVPSTDPIILPRALDTGGALVRSANCDCRNGTQARNPAGCVRVQDTQLSTNDRNTYKAVRQVKVIVKDNWFTEINIQTNDAGCFSRSDKKLSGKAWVWVKFANNKATLRMLNGIWPSYIINYGRTVTDYVGWFSGGVYNNMDIFYDFSSNIASTTHRFWRSATIMNGLQEYHDYCSLANITPPPFNLNILSTTWGNYGAAPMVNNIGKIPIGGNDIHGLGFMYACVYYLYTEAVVASAILIPTAVAALYIKAFAPDVVVAYKDNKELHKHSDQIKSILYHELAHTSHFSQVGADYWFDNDNYIIKNNGYGDGTGIGSSKCALIEMWAYYLEPLISERAYGLKHSNTTSISSFDIERTRYINTAENTFSLEGKASFIKSGLFHDINDTNPQFDPYESFPLIGKDKIGGFVPSDIFKTLTREIDSPTKFRDKFKRNSILNTQSGNYDNLWRAYGF
jgi:hypothetical protein